MAKSEAAVRKRGDPEQTRRRVLDAAIATVVDVGYYKASSNEIARRAGVTWGSIQHLFGSREQLMLDVVNDIGVRLEERFAAAAVEGATLEERLRSVLDILSTHYEQDAYLVQMQILLELAANPKMSAHGRTMIGRDNGQELDNLAQPLLAQALGDAAAEHDLVMYAFMTLRGYLASSAVARIIAKFPDDAVRRLIRDSEDDDVRRDLLVRGVAAMVREEGTRRGYRVD